MGRTGGKGRLSFELDRVTVGQGAPTPTSRAACRYRWADLSIHATMYNVESPFGFLSYFWKRGNIPVPSESCGRFAAWYLMHNIMYLFYFKYLYVGTNCTIVSCICCVFFSSA